MTEPLGARTRMPANAAAPDSSTSRKAPIASRMRDACGLRYSAHGDGQADQPAREIAEQIDDVVVHPAHAARDDARPAAQVSHHLGSAPAGLTPAALLEAGAR